MSTLRLSLSMRRLRSTAWTAPWLVTNQPRSRLNCSVGWIGAISRIRW